MKIYETKNETYFHENVNFFNLWKFTFSVDFLIVMIIIISVKRVSQQKKKNKKFKKNLDLYYKIVYNINVNKERNW